jgi:NAD+ synthetase
MCGGYAPIKDCYKTQVYALARWRNRQGDGERIPQAVIDRPPTAELRDNQRDQDSLPPYGQLDAILHRFIELSQSRDQIAAAGFDGDTVTRVIALVYRAEYKRRQSPPGPKITAKAFGRDRRYPITSAWR